MGPVSGEEWFVVVVFRGTKNVTRTPRCSSAFHAFAKWRWKEQERETKLIHHLHGREGASSSSLSSLSRGGFFVYCPRAGRTVSFTGPPLLFFSHSFFGKHTHTHLSSLLLLIDGRTRRDGHIFCSGESAWA